MGMKFRFARKKKTKPPPPPEGEEEQTEGGDGEGNGENLEQLAQDAEALAHPQETPPPLTLPEQVPPRLRLAQAQATAETPTMSQAPPPRLPPPSPQRTRPPPPVVAQRTVPLAQAGRHNLPVKVQHPIYSRSICIITKNVNGVRVVLKSLVVPSVRDFFRMGEHSFHVDISRAFMVSAKGVYLMFDYDITEPLTKNTVSEQIEHPPISLGDEAHYSPHVDLLLQKKVIEQALRSLGETGGFNFMVWILFIVGVVLGLFAGLYLAPLLHISTITTPTTTTTTTTTGRTVLHLLSKM